MAYTALTTTEDLEVYFTGFTFSSSTQPSEAEVEQWINEATALIYGAVASRYTVPVTDVTDLLILKSLADRYCVDRIKEVLAKTRVALNSSGKPTTYKASDVQFYSFLDKINNDEIKLLGTTSNSNIVPISYNKTNEIAPVTTSREDMW
jgi:phage gp36-like protein